MLSHFQPHFSNPRPDFAIRGAMGCQARTMGRNERGARRACGSEAGRRAKGLRPSGSAAALERALPHQGQNGESGNRNKNGKGKTAVDIDRKHVLIACAIAGAMLGVVLAVLQAVAPHTAGTRAH